MKAVGSLEYVAEIVARLHAKLLDTLDLVEAEMGRNKRLRIFLLNLN